MAATPAQLATQTRLQQRINRRWDDLQRARQDGCSLKIRIAEQDLNDALDQLPRLSTAQEDT